ncbi:Na(+)/H(+) exchange regulatory cofactor NHE-RF3 [Merluccius polli]|uniref:Na(+)/H(+) exchange regulatory cofactor NHE-RF3 n=1 Tax=Merluccius polli TaxID=89951 RepID=A0AA47M7Q1_MERPO|nr:Na(+)/H(+) exchange regulatory cofactor NHE-RF3 [Merluccius polli]
MKYSNTGGGIGVTWGSLDLTSVSVSFCPRFTFNPKEGIDNPALVISDDPEPNLCPVPRLCQLQRTEGQSFGFRLRALQGGRGHVVMEVEPHSPAEVGGLRDGYRVLEVNQQYVDNMEFPELLRKIQRCGLRLFLLVLREEQYEQVSYTTSLVHFLWYIYVLAWFVEAIFPQAVSWSLDLQEVARSHRGENCVHKARLCHVTRNPVQGLGLTIRHIEGNKGQYFLSTVIAGPAERAGIRNGDKLIWVNGVTVANLTFSALNKIFKRSSIYVTLLVMDRESESSCIKRRIPVVPDLAECLSLAHRPKTMHLVQGPDGYGFLLRLEKLGGLERIVHLLREVEAGSPAEQAGMTDGELLLAVNGEATETAEHEHIVQKIRDSGRRVSLTTISVRGRDYYRKLDLSPLLFYDEDIKEAQNGSSCPEDRRNILSSSSPRLCVLDRDAAGFGFHLCCVQDKPGSFIGQVAPGGSGQRAGLLVGEAIVEVDGQNVEDRCLEEVGTLIKGGLSPLKLLVVARPEGGHLRNGPPETQIVDLGGVSDLRPTGAQGCLAAPLQQMAL